MFSKVNDCLLYIFKKNRYIIVITLLKNDNLEIIIRNKILIA